MIGGLETKRKGKKYTPDFPLSVWPCLEEERTKTRNKRVKIRVWIFAIGIIGQLTILQKNNKNNNNKKQ